MSLGAQTHDATLYPEPNTPTPKASTVNSKWHSPAAWEILTLIDTLHRVWGLGLGAHRTAA